jgi:hypothetical protein
MYKHYKLIEGDYINWIMPDEYQYSLRADVLSEAWDTRYEIYYNDSDGDPLIKNNMMKGKLLRIIYGNEN